MPEPLRSFAEADWSEWLLDGPDPGTVGYVDVDRFYAGLVDRPAVAAAWRRYDARRRWREAKRAWLDAHGHHDLAFDAWLDDVVNGRRELHRELGAAGAPTLTRDSGA